VATIVTYNEARTQEVIDGTVVDGNVDGSKNLILDRHDGATISAGNVGGPKGFTGPELPQPAGQVVLFAGTVAPYGWMICNGQAISRTDYASLFAVLGTKYGSGNGSTTFNIPDFRGRLGVGQDSTQTEFDVLGESGGEKAHILTVNELPAHTHTVLGYSGWDDKNFTGNTNRLNAADTAVPFDKLTSSTGSGAAHNNLQPYLTVNYIISLGEAAPQGGGIPEIRYFTAKSRGTTAERDTAYGTPATDTARVALAQQKIVWFNTDLGWEESFYAVSGTAGLTVPGLVTGAVAGWYPTGRGPFIKFNATTGFWAVWNALIGNFDVIQRKGGASWFTYDGTITQILKHGRYDIRVWTQILEGSGAPDFFLQVLGSDGTTLINGVSGGGFDKDATFRIRAHQELYDILIAPNNKVAWKLQQGTMTGTAGMTLHNRDNAAGIGGQLTIRYVGPPLVAEH
jgi:microcystin-dependent protein